MAEVNLSLKQNMEFSLFKVNQKVTLEDISIFDDPHSSFILLMQSD